MKTYVGLLLSFFVAACYTATLEMPKKYDIYLSDINEQSIFEYTEFMSKQSYYESHKVLVISKNNSEISYTSKLAPEIIYKKTQEFFGDKYLVKLNSNVIKVRRHSYENH